MTDSAQPEREKPERRKAEPSPARRALDEALASHESTVRSIIETKLRGERPNHTLAATDIVHELYLRLAEDKRNAPWTRERLLGFSARVIRNILVDHARTRATLKRGGDFARVTLHDIVDEGRDLSDPTEILALHDALHQIESTAPDLARMIELRFFAGLTIEETAEVMGRSRGWIDREWAKAKLHLAIRMKDRASS